jgi:hypothetical protein
VRTRPALLRPGDPRILSRQRTSPMPTSWKIMMALLIVCLLASMVIAIAKLT